MSVQAESQSPTQSESQPALTHRSGLEARYGEYAVVSVLALAAEYAQVLALGQTIANEQGIAPAMIQVTPLTAVTQGLEQVSTIRYLITVTKSTGKR